MTYVISRLVKTSFIAGIALFLAACSSSSSGLIDQLLGNSKKAPILNSIADQTIQQTDTFTADINNISGGQPGNDEGMSYSCYYDNNSDGVVLDALPCSGFPNSTVNFNTATGELDFTPNAGVLGNYEFRITGTNSEGRYDEIFVLGVRLKFNGVTTINSITGTSVTISWTQPADAVGYRVFRLNTSTGDYELFRTILVGAISGTTITGLTPNTPYTIRVQAVDSLGFTDGNVVSRSFTTTELVQFSMTPATVTTASGSPETITVQAYNANGSLQTIGGLTLTPAIASGSSTGTFSAVTDNNDGTYTFTFTPVTVGSPISIDVSINMTFFVQNTVDMTVIHGPPSSTTSTLTLSANTVVSGQLINVQALIRDSNNNPIDTGSTIAFTKSGGSSTGTYSAVVNAGNGLYTTTYTGVTAGTAQTLRVSVDGTVLTLSGAITVTPGAPTSANSTLTTASSSISSGTTTLITATLRDLNNNPVPSGILVAFNKAGGTASGTFSSVVNAGAGVYTTTYEGLIAGTAQTITVSVDGGALTLNVSVAVVPGAPILANSTLTTSAPTVVSGQYVTLSGTLRDVNNNPVDTGITVTFSKTGGTSTGTFGTISNQGGGLYTVRYTGVAAGTAQTFNVLVNGTSIGASTTVSVLAGPPSATTSTIALSAATVLSGNSVTVTATLKDDNNNPISSGVLVGISKTGGTSTGTLSSITNAGSGVYTATYTGVVAGSAQTIGILVDSSGLGPTASLQVLVGAADPVNSTLTISASTVVSGQFVTATALLKDVNNNPITSGIAVTFSKSGGTATGTFGSVTNVGDGSYTIRYTGVGAGTSQTIIVLLNAVDLGKTVTVAVTPGAPSATTSTISVSSATVASGSSVTVTTTIRDDNSNPISSGVLVGFSKSGGTSTGNFASVTNAGGGQYTTTYTAVGAGSAQTLGVSVDSVALGITTTLTVVPGAPNLLQSTLDITASTVVAGSSVTVTLTLRDGNSNPISAGYVIGLAATGGTSTGSISAVTNQGNGVYTATYTGDVAGTSQTLQALVDMAGFGPTQNIQVLVGPPSMATSAITITPGTVPSGVARTISAVIRDIRNNPITNQYSISFEAIGGTSTGTLGSVNNAGSGNFSITYTGVVAGTAQTIRVLADGNVITGVTGSLAVVPGAVDVSNSIFTISQTTVQSGTDATLTANLRDVNSNRIYGRSVTFNKSSTAGSNGSVAPSPATEASVPVNSGNYSAIYSASQQGAAQTLTLVVDAVPVAAMTQTVTVISGPPAQLGVTAPATPFNTTQCVGPFTISLKDAAGNNTVSLSVESIGLSSPDSDSDGYQDHVGQVFTDSSCLTDMTTLDIPAGSNSASFYYRNYLPISYTLTFVPSVGIASNSTVMYTQPVISWIGSATTGSTMSGSGAGFVGSDVGSGFGFVDPLDMVVSGNYLYVTDRGAYRILKFDLSTTPYTYVGWVGYIESLEGISAACSAQTVGAWTANWCTGGRALATQSMNLTYGVGADATYIYVVAEHRVLRIQQTNGAYGGWIGRVATAPLPTCTGGTAVANTTSPGWCTGGTHTTGNSDGQFNNPIDVAVLGGKLYITDQSNQRIQRWSTAGVFEGWIGSVNEAVVQVTSSQDAAYAAGCAAVNTGDFTPGFCYGGVAQGMGRRNWSVTPPELVIPGEGFSSLLHIATDGTYLYASDQANARIVRIDVSANPIEMKWIGFLLRNTATNPSVPAQANSTYSTTWMTGGSTQERADGLGHYPIGISTDGTYLFYTDQYSRAMRVNIADGQNKVHLGRVSASPTGGAAGCSSTPNTGTTPGFCTGGSYQRYGAGNGAFSETRGTEVYGNEFFVIDRYNFRIQRFNKLTGQFIGWMGAVALNQDSWTMTAPNSFTRRGWNNQSFWDITNQFSSFAMWGDYLYIPDYATARIKRYNKRVGTFGGYIGIFDNTASFLPTGSDACLGITSGMTPDWCTGGGKTYASGAVQGYNAPTSLTSDGTYVYVASQGNVRIDRFNKDTTLYGGWIGRVSGIPTDGDPGCTSAAATTRTPGWCIGGGAATGNADGQFRNNLRSVFYDTLGSKLYATDDSRLFRIDPITGLNEATIGHIAAGPTGCTLGANNVPNGWCSVASAQGAGTDGYGGLNDPTAIWMNASDIFVADSGNHRIHRFSKGSGAPNGFIGRVGAITGLSVSGNCSSIVAGAQALPGWCMGTSTGVTLGAAQTGANAGEFNSPRGIWGDSTYLYVADTLNHRIVRISISNGSFQGWKGAIGSTSGISPAACVTDASTVGYTQRWCTGGASVLSSKMGGFNLPVGIIGDGNYLYIHDGKNNRMVTIPK